MTAPVCARCDAIVTTDRSMPTTPTRIPTRRVSGSATCSGLTSISGMAQGILTIDTKDVAWRARRHAARGNSFDDAQAWIGARNAEHAAAYDFDDFAERGGFGDEFADFSLGTRELHDVARGIGGQHPAAGAAHQRSHGFDALRQE